MEFRELPTEVRSKCSQLHWSPFCMLPATLKPVLCTPRNPGDHFEYPQQRWNLFWVLPNGPGVWMYFPNCPLESECTPQLPLESVGTPRRTWSRCELPSCPWSPCVLSNCPWSLWDSPIGVESVAEMKKEMPKRFSSLQQAKKST